jgi:hypothetical protein
MSTPDEPSERELTRALGLLDQLKRQHCASPPPGLPYPCSALHIRSAFIEAGANALAVLLAERSSWGRLKPPDAVIVLELFQSVRVNDIHPSVCSQTRAVARPRNPGGFSPTRRSVLHHSLLSGDAAAPALLVHPRRRDRARPGPLAHGRLCRPLQGGLSRAACSPEAASRAQRDGHAVLCGMYPYACLDCRPLIRRCRNSATKRSPGGSSSTRSSSRFWASTRRHLRRLATCASFRRGCVEGRSRTLSGHRTMPRHETFTAWLVLCRPTRAASDGRAA